jgi:hypothetical protein
MVLFRIEMRPFHRTVGSDPPPHSGCATMVFPPRHVDVSEGQKQARCSDSPARRRGDASCSDTGKVAAVLEEINWFPQKRLIFKKKRKNMAFM